MNVRTSLFMLLALAGLALSQGSTESAAVAVTLDDFHDAASKADEDRYFAHFSADGVFLGTDPKERWTVPEFRAWALPYFQRESAWTFKARDRHVHFSPDGATAWFDEVAESDSYGACRGTGVLIRSEGRWRISQYNLTIPVVNDLAKAVVTMHRTGNKLTTFYLVRHSEKVQDPASKDPPLAESGRLRATELARILGRVEFDALYASEFQRTQQTMAPLASGCGKKVTVVPAADSKSLGKKLLADHRGGTVVVAGHTNTLPDLMRGLGITDPPVLREQDQDDLFVVFVDGGGQSRLHHLHVGPQNPAAAQAPPR